MAFVEANAALKIDQVGMIEYRSRSPEIGQARASDIEHQTACLAAWRIQDASLMSLGCRAGFVAAEHPPCTHTLGRT